MNINRFFDENVKPEDAIRKVLDHYNLQGLTSLSAINIIQDRLNPELRFDYKELFIGINHLADKYKYELGSCYKNVKGISESSSKFIHSWFNEKVLLPTINLISESDIDDSIKSLIQLQLLTLSIHNRRFCYALTLNHYLETLLDWLIYNGFPKQLTYEQFLDLNSYYDELPVEELPKSTIYKWYGDFIKDFGDKSEAFDSLKSKIMSYGLKPSDFIRTDDHHNFDRSYRKWLAKRIQKK